MKKYLFTLAAAAALLMTGCNDPDKEPPLTGTEDESIAIPEDMEIAFPDPDFRSYVLRNFDTDRDGRISPKEAAAVEEIDVAGDVRYKNISSLEGIQYFINLIVLNCHSNRLTSLDVSKNTKLTELMCSYNQLTSLDVSKNTELIDLMCSYNQLTSLDVSKNTWLGYLACDNNQLTSLDVSKNTELTGLGCRNNQLTSLDVSKNTWLITLDCSVNQLTSLDVSKNTELRGLACSNNQLTSLDVSKTWIGNTSMGNRLSCNMPSLDVLYLKQGWSIEGINNNRSTEYIHPNTRIEYKD